MKTQEEAKSYFERRISEAEEGLDELGEHIDGVLLEIARIATDGHDVHSVKLALIEGQVQQLRGYLERQEAAWAKRKALEKARRALGVV